MIRHFIFQDGTEGMYEYTKGDIETSLRLSNLAVQLDMFPEVDESGKFKNPLINVFETDTIEKTLIEVIKEYETVIDVIAVNALKVASRTAEGEIAIIKKNLIEPIADKGLEIIK